MLQIPSLMSLEIQLRANAVTAPHRPCVHCPGGWCCLPSVWDPQPQQQDSVLAEGTRPSHPHCGQGDIHLWPAVCVAPLKDPDIRPGYPQHPPCCPGGCWQISVSSQCPEQDFQISGACGCHTSGGWSVSTIVLRKINDICLFRLKFLAGKIFMWKRGVLWC